MILSNFFLLFLILFFFQLVAAQLLAQSPPFVMLIAVNVNANLTTKDFDAIAVHQGIMDSQLAQLVIVTLKAPNRVVLLLGVTPRRDNAPVSLSTLDENAIVACPVSMVSLIVNNAIVTQPVPKQARVADLEIVVQAMW